MKHSCRRSGTKENENVIARSDSDEAISEDRIASPSARNDGQRLLRLRLAMTGQGYFQMNIYKKFYITLILIITLLFTAFSNHLEKPQATVLKIRGNVNIKKPENNFWIEVARKKIATSGCIVNTKENSGARLNFSNGSIIRLYEKSNLKINEVQITSKKEAIKFKALWGKFKFKVKELLNKESSFKVETPTAIISVRGTEFDMEVLGFESKPNIKQLDFYTVTGKEVIPKAPPEEALTPEEETALLEEETFSIQSQASPKDPKNIPSVFSIKPATGINLEEQTLIITGENFKKDAMVFLEDLLLEEVKIKNQCEIVAKVPAGLNPGKYRVKVVNPDKTLVKVLKGTIILTSLITGATTVLSEGSAVACAGLGGISTEALAGGGAVVAPAAAGGIGAAGAAIAIVGGVAIAALGGGGGGGGEVPPTLTPTLTPLIPTPTPTTLYQPTPTPTPSGFVLHITNPVDGSTVYESVQTLTGYSDDPRITNVYVSINQTNPLFFEVTEGNFSGTISLSSGINTIQVYGYSNEELIDIVTITVTLNRDAPSMNIKLTWDSETNMDINVVTPARKLINWADKNDPVTGGTLDTDILSGPGVENITFLNTPPEGPYWIAVNYTGNKQENTRVLVEIFLRNPESGKVVKIGSYYHNFSDSDLYPEQLPIAALQKPQSVFIVGTINFPLPEPFPQDPANLLDQTKPTIGDLIGISPNTDTQGSYFKSNPDDITPPRIQVLFPKPGDFLLTTETDIAGETENNATVELIEPATQKVWTTQADGTGYFFFEGVNLKAGENVIKLKAIDRSGNEGREEIRITVSEKFPR